MPPTGAARTILRRLHDVMAARTAAQAKLNQVVNIVAAELGSEVASIYLLRDGVLELFATRGLSQSAVHVTRLAMGQGLVGTIARTREPLALAQAKAHPDFAYRPETGEDDFESFCGVPIVRREAAIGVLAVQHRHSRDYAEVEIEALQTVGMVLSELIHGAGLVDDAQAMRMRAANFGPARLNGLKLVDGLARGAAVFHQPRVVVEHTVADDVDAERERLVDAFRRHRRSSRDPRNLQDVRL
jgi:phosphotransferase system enzyme I (PtsP)